MVKGISRQVIVVHPPDTKLFEQAIFLLRADAPGLTDAEVLRQACQVADNYVRARAQKKPRRWRGLGWMLLGAAGVGLVWLVTAIW